MASFWGGGGGGAAAGAAGAAPSGPPPPRPQFGDLMRSAQAAGLTPWQAVFRIVTKFFITVPPLSVAIGLSVALCIPIFFLMWLRGDLKVR